MPDPIKENFKVLQGTNIFIDEADFRDQLKKDPDNVFKSVAGTDLYIDYNDFEEQLGLKKKDTGASQTPLQFPSQSVGIPAAPSQPVSGLDQQIAQTRSSIGVTQPKPTRQTAQKPAQQAPIPAPPAQQLNLAGQMQATRQAIGGTQPAPQPTTAKQPFTYNTLEAIMQEEGDRRKTFEGARDKAGFASRFGITTGNLTNSAVEYEKAKRKKDEALTNFKVEISRPVDNIIEGKSKQKLDDFFVNGVFSDEKAQDWAGSIVSQYGGGSFVRDHLTMLLKEKAVEKKQSDEYVPFMDKSLEKRGINVQQLATKFMQAKQAPIIDNFELFKKEKESEATKFLEDSQNKATENTAKFQSFTDALNKQIESGQITREKAVELFNAEKDKYQKTLSAIDQAYKSSVRDINISLKRRFARIEEEVKKVNFNENEFLASLPKDIRGKYQEAMAEAQSNYFSSKNAIARAKDIMFNPAGSVASNVFTKSAASGFYNTLSNIGNSFMTDGTSNRFTRWLASFAEDAERNRTAQYGWNNPILKFSQITGQTLGGSSLQMIPTIALSAVGAGPVATTVLGGLTSAAIESQVQKGQQFEESIASGRTIDQARKDAELAFSENMKNLPLYFIGSFGAFKTFQGAGLKGFGKGLILENIEEIPLSYSQEYTAAKIKDPSLTMAKFIADNPNIALETAAGTLGMSGTVSVAGKAFNSLQRNVPSPAIQAINQIIQISDVNTAVSMAEKYFELGVIDKPALDKIKLEIPKIAASNQKMQALGVDQDRAVLLSALSDKHSSLKQQAEKETDPSVKALLQTQLSDVESDIKGITGGTSPYMKFTYPGGTNLSSYMTVREFNALPQNNQEEMIKAADKINVVGDNAVNTQINERKNSLGNAFDIDGAYTNGLTVKDTTDAISESQVQEGRTESDISQPAGAVQGQQEVGQGEGQQGQAQIAPADVSDSDIGSEGQVESKRADIERRRQEELGNYDEEGLKETYAVGSDQTVEQFINSKYDAELSALSAPQITNIEIQPAVIVQNAAPFVNEVKTAAPEVETGSTMNIDGTQYTGGGLVVPAASMNTTIEEITPEMVAQFVEDNRGKISGNNFKVGIYKFPNSNRASIDLNIVVPSANRAAALEFGKAAGQESLFDLDTFENVKTGADGTNPMSFTDEQFREIANALENNRVPNVFIGEAQIPTTTVSPEVSKTESEGMGVDQDGNLVDVESALDRAIPLIEKAYAKAGVVVEVTDEDIKDTKGNKRILEGVFRSKDGKIVISRPQLKNGIQANRVIWHEASHPVMNIIRNTNKPLYDKMVKGLYDAAKKNKFIDRSIKWASENYADKGQDTINDEAIVETLAKVADGSLNLNSLDKGLRQTIIDFVNSILDKLGSVGKKLKIGDTNLKRFRDVTTDIVNTLKEGRDISEVVGEVNVTRENVIVPDTKNTFGNDGVQARFEQEYFEDSEDFKKLEDEGVVVHNSDLGDFTGSTVVIHNPDSFATGNIKFMGEDLVNGEGGIYFVLKFGDVWASSKESTAKQMADLINTSLKESSDGKGRVVLVKGDPSKNLTSVKGAKALMGVIEILADKGLIPLSAFRKALNAAGKKYGVSFDGRSDAKSIRKDIQDKFMNVSNSSFERRGDFVRDVIDEIAKQDVLSKDNISKIAEAIGAPRKMNTFSKASIIDSVAYATTERLLMDVPNSHAYAVVETSSPVEIRQDGRHESYPWHIVTEDGSRPKLYILNNRPYFNDAFVAAKDTEKVKTGERFMDVSRAGLAQRGMGLAKIDIQEEQASVGNRTEEDLFMEGEGRERERGLARRFETLPSETSVRIEDEAKTYFQQTNKQTEEAVNEFMKDKSVEEVADYVVGDPNIPDASLVFMAGITAKKLTPMIEQARQDGNTDLAKRLADKQAAIYNTFAKKATSLGQAVQAFVSFKDDPNATQFYLNKVINQLKEKGVEVTKAQEDQISELLENVGKAKFGLPKNMAIIKLSSYLNSISPVNGFEVLEAIWYAKILSGITTQSKNLFANLFNTFFEIPVVATRESLKNKSLMPFIYAAKGAVSGFAKGSVVGADILRTGVKEQDLDKYFGNNILEYFSWGRTKVGQLGGGAVGKILDFPAFIEMSPKALRYVGRGLSAADAMFSSINQEAYANMMAWAQAVQEGKNQPTKNNYKRANEILGNTKEVVEQAKKDAAAEGFKPGTITFKRRVIELVEDSRPEQIEEASEQFGKRVTLNYEPEGFIRPIYNMIVRAQQEARLLKVWIPFTRIIANLTEQMLNYSPAGYYKAITGKRNPFGGGTKLTNDERGDLAIKATMGLAAVGVLASIVGDDEDDLFEITANGTGNIQKNYELQKEGWRPFTITLKDGTKISYADWPIRGILAGIGSYRDGVKYGDSEDGYWDRTTLFGYGMMASMYESSLMKGLAEFIDVFRPEQTGKAENVGEGVSKWAAQQAKSVTLSNFTQQALKFVDEYQGDPIKEAKGVAILYRDIPILNDGLNPVIDVFGDPVSPTTSERLVPAYTIPEKDKDELIKILHEKGIFVGVPDRPNVVDTDDKTKSPANDDQYYKYRKIYGETLKRELYERIDQLREATPERANKIISAQRKKARKKALKEL
jgi:hypothetical protein